MAAAMARRTAAGLLRPRRSYSFPYIPTRHDDDSSCSLIPSTPPPPPPRAAGVERHMLRRNAPMHLLFPLSSLPFSLRHYSSSFDGSAETISSSSSGDIANVLDGGSVIDMAAETAAVAPPAPFPGEVAAAAADSFPPVAAVQMLIDSVHSFTGLNWWACIALTTVLIRLALVPLMISIMKKAIKVAEIQPKVMTITRDLQNAQREKNSELVKNYTEELMKLYKDHGLTPLSMLNPIKGMLIQGPIFASFFFGLRYMAEKVPSFKSGGTLWFTDLTTPDAFYILPIVSTVLFLLAIELNAQEGMEGNPAVENMKNTMKNLMRGLGIITLPIISSFPEAVLCYLVTSGAFSLIYGLALKRPDVRKFLAIPDFPTTQTQTTQASQPILGGLHETSPAEPSLPLVTSKNSELPQKMVTRTSMISVRIRNLEREVKARGNKPKTSSRAKAS